MNVQQEIIELKILYGKNVCTYCVSYSLKRYRFFVDQLTGEILKKIDITPSTKQCQKDRRQKTMEMMRKQWEEKDHGWQGKDNTE